MDIKLRETLEYIRDNINMGCYPRKIIHKYYIHNNLMFTINNDIFYYGGDYKYYYFYIWLMVHDI